ncbi:putative dynein assembly factor 3, axonemal, partial [Trypanosoma cruzi]
MSYKYLHDGKEHFINGVGTELAWGWSPAVDFTEILERREKHATDDTEYVAEETKEEPEEGKTTNGDNVKKDRKFDVDIDAMIAAIQQRIPKEKKDEGSRDIVRVLLCGACDIRHIFRTLSSLQVKSKMAAQPPPVYHFFIYEPNLRIHCRYLFFLQWLLDSMFSLDELEEQVLMFLDVFGNALTRDTTSAQSRSVSQRLLRVLRNEEGELARLVSFTEMKSKERDFVEEQIVHWAFDTSQAKVEDSWLRRLRHEMAERYDNRDNIIDWDFNFYLCDYTNLIKFAEYRTWRNTGIAFDATHINPRRGFTYNYLVPNKTLCHFNAKGIGTFLGDVKNGPFFAFGAQTANTHIRAKTIDGTCKYGNGVVSMHNVRAWLYGLLTGQSWPWSDHAFAWDDPANYNYLPPGTPSDVAHQAVLPDVRFHFIGLDFTRFMQHIREKKNKKFDLAFVGTSCTQLMSPEFFEVAMAINAVVVAETAKFVI